MKPTVGRIVHYVEWDMDSDDDKATICQAAIITHVDKENEKVSLALFRRHCAALPVEKIEQDENKSAHTWHWPEREES